VSQSYLLRLWVKNNSKANNYLFYSFTMFFFMVVPMKMLSRQVKYIHVNQIYYVEVISNINRLDLVKIALLLTGF